METQAVLERLGDSIKAARTGKGWTQEELGLRAGIDSRHIGFIERAEINPTIKTLNKIAVALKNPIGGLFR